MTQEQAKYIRLHFSRLLTEKEQLAYSHSTNFDSLMDNLKDASPKTRHRVLENYYKSKMITKDKSILSLLEDGRDNFMINMAERIMSECPEKVFFNICPKCDQLARTPYAKQCKCGYSWREIVSGVFEHKQTIKAQTSNLITLRGTVHKGEVQRGMKVDLTFYGLGIKPIIERITPPEFNKEEIIDIEFYLYNEEDYEYLSKCSTRNINIEKY